MPRPRKAEEYSPENTSLTIRAVRICSCRTFDINSAESIELTSGNRNGVEDHADDVIGGQPLGLRLVAEQDAVTQHVVDRQAFGAAVEAGPAVGTAGPRRDGPVVALEKRELGSARALAGSGEELVELPGLPRLQRQREESR